MSIKKTIKSKLEDICQNGISGHIDNQKFNGTIAKINPGKTINRIHGNAGALIFLSSKVIKQELLEKDEKSGRYNAAPDTITYYQIASLQNKLDMILKIYDVVYSNTKYLQSLENTMDTTNVLYLKKQETNEITKNDKIILSDNSSVYEYKTLELGDNGDLAELLNSIFSLNLLKKFNEKTELYEIDDFDKISDESRKTKITESVTELFTQLIMYMYLITCTYKIILHFFPDFVHGDLKADNIFLKKAPLGTDTFVLNMSQNFQKVICFDSSLINNNILKFADYGNTPNTAFLNHCYPTFQHEEHTADGEVYNMFISQILRRRYLDKAFLIALPYYFKKIVTELFKLGEEGFINQSNHLLETELLSLGLIKLYPDVSQIPAKTNHYLYTDTPHVTRRKSSTKRIMRKTASLSKILSHKTHTLRKKYSIGDNKLLLPITKKIKKMSSSANKQLPRNYTY